MLIDLLIQSLVEKKIKVIINNDEFLIVFNYFYSYF
jgi:hypothetical protein